MVKVLIIGHVDHGKTALTAALNKMGIEVAKDAGIVHALIPVEDIPVPIFLNKPKDLDRTYGKKYRRSLRK